MWQRHWKLNADPFLGPGSPYVRTSGHDEVVARLIDTIETNQRLAVIRSGAGMGKSLILSRVIAETRSPRRRLARVAAPVDGPSLIANLATGLGVSIAPGSSRPAAWKALADAVRLCRWQKLQAVLIIDDSQLLDDLADRRDLERLAHLDPNPATQLTIIQAVRDPDDDPSPGVDLTPAWQLAIRLVALTRSESVRFIEEKLAAAGRTDPAFTPRALSRLHDLSGGVPRGIDRLGSLSLMAAAVRGLELVSPDVVDGVARECLLPWPEFAA